MSDDDDVAYPEQLVRLRQDQIRTVIDCLRWLAKRHEDRAAGREVVGLDEFAHQSSRARILEALEVFEAARQQAFSDNR